VLWLHGFCFQCAKKLWRDICNIWHLLRQNLKISRHISFIQKEQEILIHNRFLWSDENIFGCQVSVLDIVFLEICHCVNHGFGYVPKLVFSVEIVSECASFDILFQVVLMILKQQLNLMKWSTVTLLLLKPDLNRRGNIRMVKILPFTKNLLVLLNFLIWICLQIFEPDKLACCLVLEYGDLPEPWIRDLTNDSVVFRYVSLAYVLLLWSFSSHLFMNFY